MGETTHLLLGDRELSDNGVTVTCKEGKVSVIIQASTCRGHMRMNVMCVYVCVRACASFELIHWLLR